MSTGSECPSTPHSRAVYHPQHSAEETEAWTGTWRKGVLGGTWRMLPPPARRSRTEPAPKCFSERVRGCQSRCTRRLARHGALRGPLITRGPPEPPPAPSASCRHLLGLPTLPPGPPTTSPAGKELIRCPTFPSGHFAAQQRKCQQRGASHALASG